MVKRFCLCSLIEVLDTRDYIVKILMIKLKLAGFDPYGPCAHFSPVGSVGVGLVSPMQT